VHTKLDIYAFIIIRYTLNLDFETVQTVWYFKCSDSMVF